MSNAHANPAEPEGTPATQPGRPEIEYRDPAVPMQYPGALSPADQVGVGGASMHPEVTGPSAFAGPPEEHDSRKRNGQAIMAIVLGVLALVGAVTPFIPLLAVAVLAGVGVFLGIRSILGVKTQRGIAILGLALAGLALAICLGMFILGPFLVR